MATNLIPAGSSATQSADQTVAAGASVTLVLNSASKGTARAFVQIKDAAGAYVTVVELRGERPEMRAAVLSGPLTYRIMRPAQMMDSLAGVDVA